MAGWNEYAKPEVRALQGISRRSEVPSKDFQKNLANVNQSIKYMSEMMGIMQGGIDDANKDIIQKIKDAIDDILIIFGLGGGDTLSFDWGDLQVIFQHFNQIFKLPTFFGPGGIDILGFGKNFFDMILKPLGDFGSFISNSVNGFFEFLFSLLEGVPFIGGFIQSIAGGFNKTQTQAVQAQSTVVATQNQVRYIQDVINIRSGRSLADSGPDPTGDPTFSFSDIQKLGSLTAINTTTVAGGSSGNASHFHNVNWTTDAFDSVQINSGQEWMANIRFGGAVEKRVITYLASKSGNPQLFFDLYKMQPNGNYDFIQSSTDQAVNIGGQMTAFQALFPSVFVVDIGDVFMVKIRVEGSGYVTMPAKRMIDFFPLSGFVPQTIAASRLLAGQTRVPATITAQQWNSWGLNTIPWFSIGMDLGLKPAPRSFSDNFNRGTLGGNYILYSAPNNQSPPQIENNGFSYNRATGNDGYAIGIYNQPLISDRWYCEFRTQGMNDRPMGVWWGSTTSEGGGISLDTTNGLRVWSINNGNWFNGVQFRATLLPGSAVGGSNLWRVEHNPDTNVYAIFRNNGETSVASFTDNNGWLRTGPGYRYFAPMVSRFSFGVSFNIDDLAFGDIEVAA